MSGSSPFLGVRGIAVLLALVALKVYFHPHFPKMTNANEYSRLYLVESAVLDHALCINKAIQRHGPIQDRSQVGNCVLSDKAPGSAFLGMAVYWPVHRIWGTLDISRLLFLLRTAISLLPTLLMLLLLASYLGRVAGDERLALAGAALYLLGTPACTYSSLYFAHQASAVCLFTAFFIAASPGKLGTLACAAWGLLLGIGFSLEYQNFLFYIPIFVMLLIRAPKKLPALLASGCGTLVFVALTLGYNYFAFGGPFETGYTHLASAYFQKVHQQGFLGFTLPPKPDNLWVSFLSPSKGLFFFAPFLGLGVLGIPLLFTAKTWKEGGGVVALEILFYAFFISLMVYCTGGWSVSQRHLTPMAPFLVIPAVLLLEKLEKWSFGPASDLAWGLALVSVFHTYVSTAVFPHFPEAYRNPVYQLAIPLIREGYAPHSLGRLIGLSGLVSYLPAFLLALFLVFGLALWGRKAGEAARRSILMIMVVAAFAVPFSLLHRDRTGDEKRADGFVRSIYNPPKDGPPKSIEDIIRQKREGKSYF